MDARAQFIAGPRRPNPPKSFDNSAMESGLNMF